MAPRKGAPVEPQMASLQFNEPLSWRAGKPIATGELLRRLDVLSDELREMDQEEVDKDSLTKVAKELAGQNLLGHKDKGVRAFTACCLVDVLKICAPDAPFTGTQLKDIFTLLITSILPALSDPSNTYNTQHKYVLVSLSEVKSVVLLMDIPNSDSLTLHLFSSFFDIASGSSKASTGEQIAKDVEYHMSQVLVTIVDEAANLPTEVVDIIVAQFLRAATPGGGKEKNGDTDEKQSTLLPKELPEAYNMAKTICNACPEKMARYISQYFNDVIMDASSNSNSKPNGHRRASDGAGSDDEDAPSGPTEQDLKELNKAHKLLRELWRASPAVLQNVIPQLEAELSAESVQLRSLSTETLGDIISGIGAAGPPPLPTWDPTVYPPVKLSEVPTSPVSSSILTTPISPQSFSQAHSQAYHAFIGRKNDKSSVVRSVWTTAVGRVLLTSAGGIGLSREDEASLVRGLGEKLNDAEERVRIAAVKAISSFSFYDIMAKIAPNGGVGKPGSVLNSLSDRVRDRKHTVQVEAMTTLSRIWWVAAGEIIEGNDAVVTALGAIPTKIFDAYYANDKQLNVLLGRVMFEQLIPLDYPATKAKGAKSTGESQKNGDSSFDADKIRTERILLIVKSLDAKSKKAFFALQARQSTFAQVLQTFLKQCETYNGGVVEGDTKEVKSVLDRVIKWLADFLPDPSKSIHDLNKYAKLHDRRSYQLLRYAMDPESDFKTVYKAIKEFRKRMKSSGTSDGLLDTLDPLIYCSSSLLYNKSHVPATMQYSKNDEMGLGATAQEVLKEISEKNPQTFKSQVKEICKLIEEQAPSAKDANESGSMENLKICAGFARTSSSDLPQDRKFISALTNFALYGTPPKAAKYAIQILMSVSNKKEMHAKELLDKSVSGWTYGEDHFLTKLATMSQLSLHDECVSEEMSDEILDISTQKLLLEVRSPAQETDKSWQPDSEVDEECQAKCWALKTLVNRLRAAKDPEVAKAIAAPIFKLLNLLIFKEGEIAKTKNTPKHHKSRLRLLAAQLMLKLCTTKLFDDLLMPTDFDRLALVTQDALANVRRGFIEKLQKYLVKEKLPHRFYTIIFLTAFEPEIDFKNSIITWIRSRAQVFQVKKLNVMEGTFPRLLSMLAHHPDFNPEAADLRDHARYLLHYLTCVSNEGNIGLIYKYAERVKQARDAINPAESDNLYVMSDLAQAAIRKWEEKKGWSMQAWPGKVGLPVGLFAALPSHAVAQDIAEKQYLPEDMDELLDGVVRSIDKKKKRKAVDDDGQPAAKKTKSEKPKPSSKATKKEKAPKPKTPAKPKKSKPPRTPATDNSERRRSGRGTASKTYADVDDSEADQEMLDGVAEWEYLSQSGSDVEDDEQGEAEVEDNDEPMEDVEVEEPMEDKSDENEEHEEPQPEPTPPPPRSNGRTATKRGAAKGKPKSKEIVEEEDEIPTEQVDTEVLEEAELEAESELSEPASSPPPPKSNGKTRGKRTAPAAKASASKANGKGKGKAKATPKKKEVVVEEVVEEEAEDDELSDAPESEKEEEPEPHSEPEPSPPRTNGRATRGAAKSKAKPKAVKPKLVTPKAPVRASKPRGRGK